METVTIRVKNNAGTYHQKDIKKTCYDERRDFYLGQSFGQLAGLIEDLLSLNEKGED